MAWVQDTWLGRVISTVPDFSTLALYCSNSGEYLKDSFEKLVSLAPCICDWAEKADFCFLGKEVVSCSPLLWQDLVQEPVWTGDAVPATAILALS